MLSKKQLDFDEIEEISDVVLDLLASLTQRGVKFEQDEILKIGMIIGIICRMQEDDFNIDIKEKLQIITRPFYGEDDGNDENNV